MVSSTTAGVVKPGWAVAIRRVKTVPSAGGLPVNWLRAIVNFASLQTQLTWVFWY